MHVRARSCLVLSALIELDSILLKEEMMKSDVSLVTLAGKEFFKISFMGLFDNSQAHSVIDKLKGHGIENRDKVAMIWDCCQMSNYERDARETWQQYFSEIKSSIDDIHLVSDNIAYRTAARALGIFWRVNIKVWSNFSQLEGSVASADHGNQPFIQQHHPHKDQSYEARGDQSDQFTR
jgi:hypothetical protein